MRTKFVLNLLMTLDMPLFVTNGLPHVAPWGVEKHKNYSCSGFTQIEFMNN